MDLVLLSVLALVAAGGFLGGLARWGFLQVLPERPAIFASNLIACALAGLAAGLGLGIFWLAALVAGFAGGLSTWSTLAKQCGQLLKARRWKTVSIYLAFTLAIGVLAAGRCFMWGQSIAAF